MYRVESPEIVGKAKSLFLNIFPSLVLNGNISHAI